MISAIVLNPARPELNLNLETCNKLSSQPWGILLFLFRIAERCGAGYTAGDRKGRWEEEGERAFAKGNTLKNYWGILLFLFRIAERCGAGYTAGDRKGG